MRQLTALVAVFAVISSSAWAFDPSHEVVGQMYFSIPFGAAMKQEATPRLGLRVTYGEAPTFADRSARAPYSVFDLRSNLYGQTTLLLNGADVSQLSRSLYATEDDGNTDPAEVALKIVVFTAFYVGVWAIMSELDNAGDRYVD